MAKSKKTRIGPDLALGVSSDNNGQFIFKRDEVFSNAFPIGELV